MDSVFEQQAIKTGTKLTHLFEKCKLDAYPDPASGNLPITIGWGNTYYYEGGRKLYFQIGNRLTQAQVDKLYVDILLADFWPQVLKIPYADEMSTNQLAALISFSINLGAHFYGADGFSTISRCLRDKDWSGVPAALLLYNAGARVGLGRRRYAEGLVWCGEQPQEAYDDAQSDITTQSDVEWYISIYQAHPPKMAGNASTIDDSSKEAPKMTDEYIALKDTYLKQSYHQSSQLKVENPSALITVDKGDILLVAATAKHDAGNLLVSLKQPYKGKYSGYIYPGHWTTETSTSTPAFGGDAHKPGDPPRDPHYMPGTKYGPKIHPDDVGFKPGDYHLVACDVTKELFIYDYDENEPIKVISCLCRGQYSDNDFGKHGDTPPGLYKLGTLYRDYDNSGSGFPSYTDDRRAYGWYTFDMVELESQESTRGRSGICLHGGGGQWPTAWQKFQPLVPTLGCVRAHNQDLRDEIVPLYDKGGTVYISVYQ